MLIVRRWPVRTIAACVVTMVLVTLVHLQERLNHLQVELMMVGNKYSTYEEGLKKRNVLLEIRIEFIKA